MMVERRNLVRKMQELKEQVCVLFFFSLNKEEKGKNGDKTSNNPKNLFCHETGSGPGWVGPNQNYLYIYFFSKICTARDARRMGATRPHLCQEGVLELTKRATRANGCDARYTRNSRKTALFQHAQKYR